MTRRDRARKKRAFRAPLAASFILLLVTVTIWVCAQNWAEASARLRACGRTITSALGHAWSMLPIPASELLLILLPVLAVVLLLRALFRGGWSHLGLTLLHLLCAVCALVFCFVCWYGVQYTAPPLAKELGLTVRESTAEQLQSVVRRTADLMNEYAPEVPRDENGACDFGSYSEEAALVMKAYASLTERYPIFAADVAAPKRSRLLGTAMSYVGNSGYFFPWTGESIVSYDNVQSHIPFNIAHESAHARGIGPEAECNFAAYLACVESDDPRLIYSAAFNAYVYAANALNAVAPDLWEVEYNRLCDQSKYDIKVLNEYVHKYDGPVKDLGESVNDSYIKATGQPEGLQSYGLMVDLLIAYYDQVG